jgi:uncharacterized protein
MSSRYDLTPEKWAAYRETMHRRQETELKKLASRRKRAWEIVRLAARLLQESFGASRVLVFGSLTHGLWFSQSSDIDLAAWGIKNEDYFLAVAKLQDLSQEFSIDLVQMENCKPDLKEIVLQQGKELL